jgi:hypothetical protein
MPRSGTLLFSPVLVLGFKAVAFFGKALRRRAPDLDGNFAVVAVERVGQVVAFAGTIVDNAQVTFDLGLVGNGLAAGADKQKGQVGRDERLIEPGRHGAEIAARVVDGEGEEKDGR